MADKTEREIQQKMNLLFEKIIEEQLEYIVQGKQSVATEEVVRNGLKRDFRNMFISRDEYLRVCQKGGSFSLLYDCGSGSYTHWFLYNSDRRNRLFMIWVHRKTPNVVDYPGDEYLGVLGEQHEQKMDTLDTLHAFCVRQYLHNLCKIMGGFRDDVGRITQL